METERFAAAAETDSQAEPLTTRIVRKYGVEVDASVSLEAETEADADFASVALARLADQESTRYRLKGEVGKGGMGAVLRVWDENLRRHLAMKVILGPDGETSSGDTPPVEPKMLARFLEEAQVTGQLDHPGIVPVHELGLDEAGQVYFTMKLVKGRTLGEVIDMAHESREEWSQTRVLEVILKVCDAMAYAHEKGVIHRDLKPANIMVGRFGAVYVMDWGLARILGRPDKKDVRIQEQELPTTALRSVRQEEADSGHDSPLLTMDGDVVGTPAYMSPEQADGRVEELAPPSDVYAVGAILYHALAGHMPYVKPGAKGSNYAIWNWVRSGPPESLESRAPDTPPELVSICEKAMAREIDARYDDMSALSDDLRAFLDGRVVGAYQTGALVEFRKWVGRNRGIAGTGLIAILLLVLWLATTVVLKERSDTNARMAALEKTNVLRLSAYQDFENLIAEADSEEMWPMHPDRRGAYTDWLERAGQLVGGLESSESGGHGHYRVLEDLRSRIADHDKQSSAGEQAEDGTYAEVWWVAQVERLVDVLERLGEAEGGLMGRGVSSEIGWGVGRRLDFVLEVEERSLQSDEARASWDQAIRLVSEDSRFDGFELSPQLGLMPLGPDPETGLIEFADLQTGNVPARGEDGRLVPREGDGLIFVLIPGGTFHVGSQSDDREKPNYFLPPDGSPLEKNEIPMHAVTIDPFMISKFELTQDQWARFVGANPSFYPPGPGVDGRTRSPLHPVEGVSWNEAQRQLHRLGFDLPTEVQWERAARGGTTTPWSFGTDPSASQYTSNVADSFGRKFGPKGLTYESWSDGHATHSPVGTYQANPFGLHDVHGNVWEWCRDHYAPSLTAPTAPGDGERQVADAKYRRYRTARGGCFEFTAGQTRCSNRYALPPQRSSYSIGLRPTRRLDP